MSTIPASTMVTFRFFNILKSLRSPRFGAWIPGMRLLGQNGIRSKNATFSLSCQFSLRRLLHPLRLFLRARVGDARIFDAHACDVPYVLGFCEIAACHGIF